MTAKKKKKKMSGRKKILLFSAEILLLLVIVGVAAAWKGLGLDKLTRKPKLTSSEAGINEDIDPSTLDITKEYTNIAVFGLDNRESGQWDSGNSDSIMVVSIKNDTKEVRIASVFRDTYLNVGQDTSGQDVYKKINSAYARGGIKNAVKCLNSNLDLTIDSYVCVDWKALVEVIDAIGGVDVKITDFEVDKINHYVRETARSAGVEGKKVKKSGKVTLDGVQATSYARIRYGDGLDMMRTSRQRIILQAMMKKAKNAGFPTLVKICNSVMDDIETAMDLNDLLWIAQNVTSYELKETYGFPANFVLEKIKGEECVVAADLYTNVSALHKFLFHNDHYTASQTVLDRNNTLVSLTGVTESSASKMDFEKLGDVVGAEGTAELWDRDRQEKTKGSEN